MPNTQIELFDNFFQDSIECLKIAEELMENLKTIKINLTTSQKVGYEPISGLPLPIPTNQQHSQPLSVHTIFTRVRD